VAPNPKRSARDKANQAVSGTTTFLVLIRSKEDILIDVLLKELEAPIHFKEV